VWNDTRNSADDSLSQLFYAYSLDVGDTWLGNKAMTPQFNQSLGYPDQNKLGDYYDMVSDETGVNLAFAATFNGEQDVYFMRITAVPEPSALLIAGLAALGGFSLILRQRRNPRRFGLQNRRENR
jgi:hypothetical protein